MSYVTAIVVAAGKGFRLRSKVAKPLVEIKSQPLIIYSLKTLSNHPDIRDIIVVVNSQNLKNILNKIKQFKLNKIKDVVLGGRLRQDSVYNGLKALDTRSSLVLIHDACRPFINQKMVSSVIREAKRSGAAILGVPLKATIKKIQNPKSKIQTVEKTLNRNTLWEIQTPHVFKKDLILEAYKKFKHIAVTDDAMLAERMGVKVSVVTGSYDNIKITTPEDLILAKAIANGL